VSGHMYLVNDKKATLSLVHIAKAAANKVNIRSSGLSEEPKEQIISVRWRSKKIIEN
jgi:hypothetical protein